MHYVCIHLHYMFKYFGKRVIFYYFIYFSSEFQYIIVSFTWTAQYLENNKKW